MMDIVDYAEQPLCFADLLAERGVQLDADELLDLREDLVQCRESFDCPRRTIVLGDWAVITEGLDETINLLDALGGDPR